MASGPTTMTYSVDAYEEFPGRVATGGLYARIADVDLVNTSGLSSTFRNARFSFPIRPEGDYVPNPLGNRVHFSV